MRTDNAVVVCIPFVCTHILYFLWRSFSRKRTSYSLFESICIFLLYSWKELCFLCSWKTPLHNTLFCTENANPLCWIFAITPLKEFFFIINLEIITMFVTITITSVEIRVRWADCMNMTTGHIHAVTREGWRERHLLWLWLFKKLLKRDPGHCRNPDCTNMTREAGR